MITSKSDIDKRIDELMHRAHRRFYSISVIYFVWITGVSIPAPVCIEVYKRYLEAKAPKVEKKDDLGPVILASTK